MIAPDLTLGLVIGAAAADSINPCVFGVLIFLIAFMTKLFKNPNRMLVAGLFYTAIVYATYLLLGFGILKLALNTELATSIYWIAALIAIGAGLLEIKDYFWYGEGISLQMIPGADKRIKYFTNKIATIENKSPIILYLFTAALGIFVVLVELPCTGAPYFAILALLSKGAFAAAVPLLLLYNFIFIIPLFVIIGIAYYGVSSKKMEKWRLEERGVMRLGIGLFLIALGFYMIYSIT